MAQQESHTFMLDPIQNQALRLYLGSFWTSPNLYVEANETKTSCFIVFTEDKLRYN